MVWIIFFILFSSTWIFNVFINPKDFDLLENLKKELRFKNFLFIKGSLPFIEDKYNIIFLRNIYIPWGVYLKYERERTLIQIEHQGKNYFYNQRYQIMNSFIPFDGTIKVEGINDIYKIKDIIETFREFRLKRVVFNRKYFTIYTEDFTLKVSLDDFKAKKKYILEISRHIDLKDKILDFRFNIPTIGGL